MLPKLYQYPFFLGWRGVLAHPAGIVIINGMLTMRADKWLRVAAGCVLLLLLAAQEKLCPWLLNPPPQPDAGQVAGAQPAELPSAADPAAEPETKQRPLPYLLPDATAPRWPASWQQVTVRQTTGARDGVVACGQRDPSPCSAPFGADVALDQRAWYRALLSLEPVGPLEPPTLFVFAGDPAIETCISRTGPPVG